MSVSGLRPLRLAASLSAALLLLGASPGFGELAQVSSAILPAATGGSDTWLLGLAPTEAGDDREGGAPDAPIPPFAEAAGRRDGVSGDLPAHPDLVARRLAAAEAGLATRLGRPLTVRHRYLRGWPGIALDLQPQEVAALRRLPHAAWSVPVPNPSLPLAMDLSPGLIGAPAAWGLATAAGGSGSRGEGVLVGIIDGGVMPDHPSFAAQAEDGYQHRWDERAAAGGYLGWCRPGHPRHTDLWACNDKLVGLYSWPEAGDDPRDDLGHGSHVAAIAAGNPLAEAWLEAPGGRQTRSISGIAPRAHVISYDACRAMACPSSAILAAIDQALADGVDVLNLSIALSQEDPWQDPVALALLAARAQGISVTAAAGNAGAAGTVAAPAPWILSVGASSHGRDLVNARWEDNPARRDRLASFSAQGPARSTRCCRRPGMGLAGVGLDLLKPDLVAPGVEVLSADLGPGIAVLPRSGTSMAAPQAAGALAVLHALHPGWSAAERQSALLLNAAPLVLGAGQHARLGAGAGRLDLDASARSGLLLDSAPEALRRAGDDPAVRLRELNLPALVDGSCHPACRFHRRLRGAAGSVLRWTAAVELMPAGSPLQVEVSPSSFSLGPGEEIEVTVDVVAREALDPALWIEGGLRWTADDPRRPDAVLPMLLRARPALLPPAIAVAVADPAGEAVVAGAEGPGLGAAGLGAFGLTQASLHSLRLEPDPSPHDPYDDPRGTVWLTLDRPGERLDRLVAEVVETEARDLDLYLGPDRDGDGRPSAAEQACAANLTGALELCEVLDPAPGPWWILLQNWQGSGAQADDVLLATAAVLPPFAGRAGARWLAAGGGADRMSLALSWTLPELRPLDRWYGVLRPSSSDGLPLEPLPVDLYSLGQVSAPSSSPTPTREATSVPRATASATASPSASPAPCLCAAAAAAPVAVVQAALANPERVAGWNRPANPNLPPGPWNPPRRCLGLEQSGRAWHPLANGLVFRAGCP